MRSDYLRSINRVGKKMALWWISEQMSWLQRGKGRDMFPWYGPWATPINKCSLGGWCKLTLTFKECDIIEAQYNKRTMFWVVLLFLKYLFDSCCSTLIRLDYLHITDLILKLYIFHITLTTDNIVRGFARVMEKTGKWDSFVHHKGK